MWLNKLTSYTHEKPFSLIQKTQVIQGSNITLKRTWHANVSVVLCINVYISHCNFRMCVWFLDIPRCQSTTK